MKYRKKPVVIEAIQFTGENYDEVCEFIGIPYSGNTKSLPFVSIVTLEGTMRTDVNDYIIKGIKGEFYPCKPDIFQASYEEVK